MKRTPTRRSFIKQSTGGMAAASGGLGFLSHLPAVSAQDAKLKSDIVRFDDPIEPVVRLIEESSREELLGRVADGIQKGWSYQTVLAALLLAGIRNVQPRPSVGFKFHCVLVVNSCHLASLAGPDQDRWLPLFWALDYFKSAQAAEARRSGWRMKPVDEGRVPTATKARQMFIDGMDSWDVGKAEVAAVGIVRHLGATEVFNLFARYAARDYRSIGHKAIYLANAWRTLQVIGWEFAEPVMRSLVFALLNHSGESNPAQSDHAADRPWRQNADKLSRIPTAWLDGKIDDGVPLALFQAFRSANPNAAANTAVEALARGVSPQSIWDGVFVGAGELLMRQPGIIGLHGLTTANAMHFLWSHVADDSLRRQLLLQACSFNPLFRQSAKNRGKLGDQSVEELETKKPKGSPQKSIEVIFDSVSSNRMKAAEQVYGYLLAGGDRHQLVDEARRVLFQKGRDAHDYKFCSAVLEDYDHVSPSWRNQFMAMSVFNLKGSGHPDSGLVERTAAAFS